MIETLKQTLDKKLFKYLLIFIFLAFLVSTGSSLIGKWEGIAYNTLSWGELFASIIIRYVSKTAFILAGIVGVRYLFLRQLISKWTVALFHFVFALGLTFYSIFIQVLASNWFFEGKDELTWNYVYSRAILGTDYNFFLYFCLIAIVYAYYFFKKQTDFELKESNLKSQLLNAKMNALQAQLQPHFLFNALNDIASLVEESPEKAQDVISDLSDMLRDTLRLSNTKFVLVSAEIELINKYLHIEQVRFGSKLEILTEIPNQLLSHKMPPLLLQPIIENAIKHGFSYQNDTLTIAIDLKEDKEHLVFLVSNNGAAIKENEIRYGVGIGNILSRLSTLFNDDFMFEMKNRKEGGVLVTLKIPKIIS